MELDQQHYIPKSYIKRFSVKNKIKVYDKELKKFFITNPNNIAKEKGYNCVKEKNIKEKCVEEYGKIYPESIKEFQEIVDDELFLEKMLSRIESDANSIFNLLIAKNDLIKDETIQQKLLIFFHSMIYRNPSFEKANNYIKNTTKSQLEKLGIRKEKMTQYILEDTKVQQQRELLSIGSLLRFSDQIYPYYDWYIGLNNTKIDLIINDNPCRNFFLNANEICFPINTRNAIILLKKDGLAFFTNDKPINDNQIIMSDYAIKFSNAMMVANSKRYIMFNPKNDDIEKWIRYSEENKLLIENNI